MIAVRRAAAVIFGWQPEDELSETAWLNGVRGLAAFCVMLGHFNLAWLSPYAEAPFGATVTGDRLIDGIWYFKDGHRLWAPWRLPIIRSFMVSGGGQVALFFVISGFALTWGPLKAVYAGDHERLYQSLGSSTVRRWLRLYLPCIIVSFGYLADGLVKKYDGVGGLLSQTATFLAALLEWSNPFQKYDRYTIPAIYGYFNVIWTIPLELGGSIFVWVILLGLGRVQSYPKRLLAMLTITLIAVMAYRWDLWLFSTGLILADSVRYRGGFNKIHASTSAAAKVFWNACLALSYLFLSFMPPSPMFNRPGYEWMSSVPIPADGKLASDHARFWWGCGGVLMITSACHLRWVQRFFELPFLQHLGKMSFMLYLIHYLIHHTFGWRLYKALFSAVCRMESVDGFDRDVYISNAANVTGIWILLFMVTVPAVLIAAHVLERYVDRPCTALGKTLDNKLVDRNTLTRKHAHIGEEEQEGLLHSNSSASVLEMAQRQPSRSPASNERLRLPP